MNKLDTETKKEILDAMSEYINYQLSDPSGVLSIYVFPSISAQIIKEQCVKDVQTILSQDDVKKELRVKILSVMGTMAQVEVLILNPENKRFGVSGELNQYLSKVKEVNSAIKTLSNKIPLDLLTHFCKSRHFLFSLYLSVFNVLRVAIGDNSENEEQDWLGPVYNSICLMQENVYREEIGLNSIVDENNRNIKLWLHSMWIELLMNQEDPRKAWEHLWKSYINHESPYLNKVILVSNQ